MRASVAVAACLLILCAMGCTKSEPIADTKPVPKSDEPQQNEPVKQYELNGQVVRVDPNGHIATIKHQAIGDWMGAMTMDFPVKDPADFDKLKPGEPVRATVNVQGFNYWVSGVQSGPGTAAKGTPAEHGNSAPGPAK